VYKFALSLCLVVPTVVWAQTHVTPEGSGGAAGPGPSRGAILRQFADDPDVRAQREAYESQKRERELERQRVWREQDQQILQGEEKQRSRFYCAVPAHQSEPECR
jgi:hypothetical protein